MATESDPALVLGLCRFGIGSPSASFPDTEFPEIPIKAAKISSEVIPNNPSIIDRSGWHISQDPEVAQVDRYTGATCLFNGKKKMYCPGNGLAGFSQSKTNGRVIAWGASNFHVADRGEQVVAVLNGNGRTLSVWKSSGTYYFIGRALPEKDFFVAMYQTSWSSQTNRGIVHVRALDFSGKQRWYRRFESEFIGGVSVTSDGRRIVASMRNRTLILDENGKTLKRYGSEFTSRLSPSDERVLLSRPGMVVVHDFAANAPIFTRTFPESREASWQAMSFSSDAERLLILSKNLGVPAKDVSAQITAIYVADLRKRELFRADIVLEVGAIYEAGFDPGNRVFLNDGNRIHRYDITQ